MFKRLEQTYWNQSSVSLTTVPAKDIKEEAQWIKTWYLCETTCFAMVSEKKKNCATFTGSLIRIANDNAESTARER